MPRLRGYVAISTDSTVQISGSLDLPKLPEPPLRSVDHATWPQQSIMSVMGERGIPGTFQCMSMEITIDLFLPLRSVRKQDHPKALCVCGLIERCNARLTFTTAVLEFLPDYHHHHMDSITAGSSTQRRCRYTIYILAHNFGGEISGSLDLPKLLEPPLRSVDHATWPQQSIMSVMGERGIQVHSNACLWRQRLTYFCLSDLFESRITRRHCVCVVSLNVVMHV